MQKKWNLRNGCADVLQAQGENFLLLRCDKVEVLVQKFCQMAIFAPMLAEGVWWVVLLRKKSGEVTAAGF